MSYPDQKLYAIGRRLKKLLRPRKRRWVWYRKPSYYNRHEGRDILIIAAGPSVKKYREKILAFIKERNPIVIGVNNCFDILPKYDYVMFTSHNRFDQFSDRLNTCSARLLLSVHYPRYEIEKRISREYEYIMYKGDNDNAFDIKNGVIQASCKSVAVLGCGVAFVMGGKNVYAAGIDGWSKLIDHGENLHCNDSKPKHDRSTPEFKQHYLKSQEYQTRFLNEISEYTKQCAEKRFSIITPTEYTNQYDPRVLGIDDLPHNI